MNGDLPKPSDLSENLEQLEQIKQIEHSAHNSTHSEIPDIPVPLHPFLFEGDEKIQRKNQEIQTDKNVEEKGLFLKRESDDVEVKLLKKSDSLSCQVLLVRKKSCGTRIIKRVYQGKKLDAESSSANAVFRDHNPYKLLLCLQQRWNQKVDVNTTTFRSKIDKRTLRQKNAKYLFHILTYDEVRTSINNFPRVLSIHEQYEEGKVVIDVQYVNGFSVEKKKKDVLSFDLLKTFFSEMEKSDLVPSIPTNLHDLPLIDKVNIVLQIAVQLKILHSFSMYHGDVKPANIVWDPETKKATLIDFDFLMQYGWSSVSEEDKLRGTPNYLAPEMLRNIFVSEEKDCIDLHAFAITILVIFTELEPYGVTTTKELYRIIKSKPPHIVNQLRELLAPHLPKFTNLNAYYDNQEIMNPSFSSTVTLDVSEKFKTSLFLSVIELLHRSEPSKRRIGLDRILDLRNEFKNFSENENNLITTTSVTTSGIESFNVNAKEKEPFNPSCSSSSSSI